MDLVVELAPELIVKVLAASLEVTEPRSLHCS
jgi:hypothetical protein